MRIVVSEGVTHSQTVRKRPYQKPTLQRFGNVAELTKTAICTPNDPYCEEL